MKLYIQQLRKLATRPAHIFSMLRGRLLFVITRFLTKTPLFQSEQIRFGRNVRLQKLSCLMAEKPHARIDVGDDTIIYEDAKIEAYGYGQISIGANSIIGRAQIFSKKKIQIGSHVVTSWNVFIQDYAPHPTDAELRRTQMELMTKQFTPSFDGATSADELQKLREKFNEWTPERSEIIIGNNVWIGANTSILQGANIGDNCIVAAHAVVVKGNYPPNSVLAGVPAKII